MAVLKFKDDLGAWRSIPAIQGPQGVSAYAQAVSGGYTGSEAEFLADLAATDGLASQLAAITSAVVDIENGAPAAVFATTAALGADATANTVDGKKRAYVVTADGKWYFWNGSAWTEGGVYQAVSVADGSILPEKTNFIRFGKNLFNKLTVTEGKYVNYTTGNLSANAAYHVSDFIPIQPNTVYTRSFGHQLAFYTSGKTYISGVYSDATVTSPENAAYARMGLEVALLDTFQFEEGAAKTAYEEHHYLVGNTLGGVPVYATQKGYVKSKLSGKVMANFGDSITKIGYSSYIQTETGMTVHNFGLSSQRWAYANEGEKEKYGMYAIANAIATGVWTVPESLVPGGVFDEQIATIARIKAVDFDDVDFVTIALGTNDFTSGTTLTDSEDLYDTATLPGAIRYAVKTLLTAYPHLTVMLLTPIYRFWVDVDGTTIIDDSDVHTIGGYQLPAMVSKIIEIGAELKLPAVNMYSELGINAHNRIYWFAYTTTGVYDGIHPRNAATLEKMGNKVAGALLSKC